MHFEQKENEQRKCHGKSIVKVNIEGAVMRLVSGSSSLTDRMHVFGFGHGPLVLISNPDSSSVFHVCPRM